MCVELVVRPEENSCKEALGGQNGDWTVPSDSADSGIIAAIKVIAGLAVTILIFAVFSYWIIKKISKCKESVPHTNSSDCNALIFYICPNYWLAEHKDSSRVMSIWSYLEQVLNVVGQMCCFVHCLRSSEVNQIFKFENI
ncbi:uncharacterized protein LOC106096867 [Oreochromis niloticus]|uniref:uncharacterized protein LOC106096867 n=1 Tax=Oreochromis niloticus TaxID=8128 RepID=UPI000DF3901F|nr:uncharacterized protein LOC106096867 [Oreochromis niloticus]